MADQSDFDSNDSDDSDVCDTSSLVNSDEKPDNEESEEV